MTSHVRCSFLQSRWAVVRFASCWGSDPLRQWLPPLGQAMLKRKMALTPPAHGLIAAGVDGHVGQACYKRHGTGWLERTWQTPDDDGRQDDHRVVSVSLITNDLRYEKLSVCSM